MSAIRTEKLLVLRPSRPPHNVYMGIHVKFYLDNYFLIEGKMWPYRTLCRLAASLRRTGGCWVWGQILKSPRDIDTNIKLRIERDGASSRKLAIWGRQHALLCDSFWNLPIKDIKNNLESKQFQAQGCGTYTCTLNLAFKIIKLVKTIAIWWKGLIYFQLFRFHSFSKTHPPYGIDPILRGIVGFLQLGRWEFNKEESRVCLEAETFSFPMLNNCFQPWY